MRWTAAVCGWAAVVLAGGCEQPRTELVARVDSELAWGVDQRIQSVTLTVRRGGASGPLRSARTTTLGAGGDRRSLPLYVGVIAGDDDVETPVWIEALGCASPAGCGAAGAVVAQRALVRFTRGQTEEVPLLLAAACAGAECADDQRCATDLGRCEAASRAQAMVRPFIGPDAATAMDARMATDVTGDRGSGFDGPETNPTDAADVVSSTDRTTTDATDVADAGSDVIIAPDGTVMDVQVVVDVPASPDLGTAGDRPTPVDVTLPPADDGRLVCPTGRTPCGSTCRDVTTDRGNCGSCDRACATSEACVAGSCVAPVTPRPIAPLSTAIVTSRRPMLRWALPSGSDGAAVEICRDRACTSTVTTFSASGDRGAPTTDLPSGVLFWRLRGRTSGVTDARYSPTWQFTVGARSAPVNASSGTVPDFNGDGFADLVVGATGFSQTYVYAGGSGGLPTTPTTTLTLPTGTSGSGFGSSLAVGDVNGDGYSDLALGYPGGGAIYIHIGGADGLAARAVVRLSSPGNDFGSGDSMAGVGDVNGDGYADLVIGAYGYMDSTGRVHVFLGNISGISATPSATLLAPDGAASQFGRSLAGAGDVNGDGYGDIVIGAPGVMASAGRAYVYLGRSGGPGATPSWTLLAPDGGTFGWSVSGAGDVNGDGYEDVVVAAIGTMPGRAYVYLGNSSGLVGTPGLTLSNPGSTFRFGQSVASAGDVNGDGYADLIVGGAATGSSFGVRAWVYLGGVSGLATTPASTFPPIDGSSSRTLSVAVVGIGDVNGDGYAEVAVTDPESMTYTGRVFVYTGSSTGLDAARSTTLTGSRTGARFGESVAP